MVGDPNDVICDSKAVCDEFAELVGWQWFGDCYFFGLLHEF